MIDVIIENGLLVTHEKVIKNDIAIKNGKIFKIGNLKNTKAKERIDAQNLHILPGVFDTQVHFREPGKTKKEDLKTGSLAAVAGGVTTVFDMPNNKPSITTSKLFKDKLFESNKESQVISKETNKLIIEMLEETVNSDTGTARAARLKGRVVAGKTGTAMESLKDDSSYTATFSGFVPSNNPDYLSVVVLHGLKGEESSGGRVAAPVFSDIMHEIYMLNDLEI